MQKLWTNQAKLAFLCLLVAPQGLLAGYSFAGLKQSIIPAIASVTTGTKGAASTLVAHAKANPMRTLFRVGTTCWAVTAAFKKNVQANKYHRIAARLQEQIAQTKKRLELLPRQWEIENESKAAELRELEKNKEANAFGIENKLKEMADINIKNSLLIANLPKEIEVLETTLAHCQHIHNNMTFAKFLHEKSMLPNWQGEPSCTGYQALLGAAAATLLSAQLCKLSFHSLPILFKYGRITDAITDADKMNIMADVSNMGDWAITIYGFCMLGIFGGIPRIPALGNAWIGNQINAEGLVDKWLNWRDAYATQHNIETVPTPAVPANQAGV